MASRLCYTILLLFMAGFLSAQLVSFTPMASFCPSDQGVGKGVSALYAGVHQRTLIAAAGCNFPNTPAADGGPKVYYDTIYVMAGGVDSLTSWQCAGRLPQPMAYGVSVSTEKGVVIAGGCNSEGAIAESYLLSWDPILSTLAIDTLPTMPYSVYNMAGCYKDGIVYITGGVVAGVPSDYLMALHLNSDRPYWEVLPSFPNVGRLQPIMSGLEVDGQSRIYLWGGYTSATLQSAASVWTDGYYYQPQRKEWHHAGAIQIDNTTDTLASIGAVAVAISDHQMLCLAGVDRAVFKQAIDREGQILEAKSQNNQIALDSLQEDSRSYLRHPSDWYKFNQRVLLYDAQLGCWKELAKAPQTALAGASLSIADSTLFLYNGELKPGIRTPLNWKLTLYPKEVVSPINR